MRYRDWYWCSCWWLEGLIYVGCWVQDICMAAVGLLQQMLASAPQRGAALAGEAEAMRQLEAAAQLLGRKADLERKYLERLEGGGPSEGSGECPKR